MLHSRNPKITGGLQSNRVNFRRSFLAGFSGLFCLRLLVFFSVKRPQFSFGTFSNIQQDSVEKGSVAISLMLNHNLTGL